MRYNKIGRKNKTLAQKQKRPRSHFVGKCLKTSEVNFSSGIPKILLLLQTNKEYRRLEVYSIIGGALIWFPALYLFIGWFYLSILGAFMKSFSAQLLESAASRFFEHPLTQLPTRQEMIESYIFGFQPTVVFAVIVFLILSGFYLCDQSAKKQKEIENRTDIDKLKQDFLRMMERK